MRRKAAGRRYASGCWWGNKKLPEVLDQLSAFSAHTTTYESPIIFHSSLNSVSSCLCAFLPNLNRFYLFLENLETGLPPYFSATSNDISCRSFSYCVLSTPAPSATVSAIAAVMKSPGPWASALTTRSAPTSWAILAT